MDVTLPVAEWQIDVFLAAFEEGWLPKERWTHGAHLLTGACYVHALGQAAALERMRERVSAYNLAVGGQNTATSGYHETVTVFWIKTLTAFLAQERTVRRAEFARRAVAEFEGRKEILREFYSYDVVASEVARRVWVPPDRKKIGQAPHSYT